MRSFAALLGMARKCRPGTGWRVWVATCREVLSRTGQGARALGSFLVLGAAQQVTDLRNEMTELKADDRRRPKTEYAISVSSPFSILHSSLTLHFPVRWSMSLFAFGDVDEAVP